MGSLLPVVAFAIVVVVAIAAARTKWARGVDDRAYESKVGWLMPFGLFWKLGRRDERPGERFWPYFLNPIGGWVYNAGRERRARENTGPPSPIDGDN